MALVMAKVIGKINVQIGGGPEKSTVDCQARVTSGRPHSLQALMREGEGAGRDDEMTIKILTWTWILMKGQYNLE